LVEGQYEYRPMLQAFSWVLIDLIVELLVLIIKPFDNQTEMKSSIK
jgi:quinol-cytochrome oxidoreductase complex cytochrome b subunit